MTPFPSVATNFIRTLTVRQLIVIFYKFVLQIDINTTIAVLTMTSFIEARHDLEHSVEIFLDCKSLITKNFELN